MSRLCILLQQSRRFVVSDEGLVSVEETPFCFAIRYTIADCGCCAKTASCLSTKTGSLRFTGLASYKLPKCHFFARTFENACASSCACACCCSCDEPLCCCFSSIALHPVLLGRGKGKRRGARDVLQKPIPPSSVKSISRSARFKFFIFSPQPSTESSDRVARTEAYGFYCIIMAGPPLALSSNVNMPKEDKTEEQPCPKRRRKSIDDSNSNNPDAAEEAPAAAAAGGGAPAQDGDGELGSTCERMPRWCSGWWG